MHNPQNPYPPQAPSAPPTYGGGFGVAPYNYPVGDNALDHHGGDETLATRGARFGARLIDGLLLLLCACPGIAYLLIQGDKEELTAFVLMGVGAVILSIYQWVRIVRTGQTLGKAALNIKVVKNDGSPVGFVDGVLLREWAVSLVGVVPVIGRFIGLIDALMIYGAERRCLHDQIAKTKVIAVVPGSFAS